MLTPSTEEGVKIFLKLEIISHIIQMCKNKMPNASSGILAQCALDNLLQALVKHSPGSPAFEPLDICVSVVFRVLKFVPG